MHYGRKCHRCGGLSAAHSPRCQYCGSAAGRPVMLHPVHATGLSFGDLVPSSVTSAIEQAKQAAAKEVADVTSSVADKYGQAKAGVTSAISSAQQSVQQTYEQAKQGLLGGAGGPALPAPEPPKEEGLGVGVYIAGAVALGAALILLTQMSSKKAA